MIDDEHAGIVAIGSYLDGLDAQTRRREVKQQIGRRRRARSASRRPVTPARIAIASGCRRAEVAPSGSLVVVFAGGEKGPAFAEGQELWRSR